jgi:uncharacterized membrane protein
MSGLGTGPVVTGPRVGLHPMLGAAAGGMAGGVIGALMGAGICNEDAHVYAEGMRQGGALVIVQFADADRTKCEAILGHAAVM